MKTGQFMDVEMGTIFMGLVLEVEQLGPKGPFVRNTCKQPVYIIGVEELIV